MKHLLRLTLTLALALPALADYKPDTSKDLGFPIYKNASSGKQLSGAHAPAPTPALAPGESQKAIQLPPGFEARLFASEPEVVNPVAMTWDDRGRLWVLELYEYPLGARKGEKGRDRIKILEDTDGDGKADKVTVFADGFSLATGLALGNGGVYLGAAPNLYFLEDTDGDDKADKTTVLKTGFGMEDRHELLNGFAWGPDGWLYMTHGVFTSSKVRDPNDPKDTGVVMNAALARYHPRTKKFEVFADGTSNPWGVDWNERGDAFVSACVIQHLFHMAPGGQYNRQGGTWANPYGYVGDLPSRGLPAIVDWRHFRAAHSGITIYQGDQYPAEWRGLVFLGNIHQSAINCDRLTPVGATYKAEKESKLLGPSKGDFAVGAGNFLVSKDPWFRPVSTQTGPDGALWIADWYDKYPCYQNANADPEGVDREHGRIWRIVWVGDQPGKAVASRPSKEMNLAKQKSDNLVDLLSHPNSWQRRQAQRLLGERPGKEFYLKTAKLVSANSDTTKLSALAALTMSSSLNDELLDRLSRDRSAIVRAWSARLQTQRSEFLPPGSFLGPVDFPKRFLELAEDNDAVVRAGVAGSLRQHVSQSLTIDTPPLRDWNTVPVLRSLISHPSVEGDFYYPHIVWMAMEPRVAQDPEPFFPLVSANDNSVSAYCLRRVMRRICDQTDSALRARQLNGVVKFLDTLAAKPALASVALDGLLEGFKTKGAPPTSLDVGSVLAKYYAQPALAVKARRLGVLWGETGATFALINTIADTAAPADKRLEGIQAAREARSDAARAALLQLVRIEKDQALVTEGLRALGEVGSAEADTAEAILASWKNYSPVTRRAAADVLVTRRRWQEALLSALETKTVPPGDVSASAVRTLTRSQENAGAVAKRAAQLFGKVRDADADKLKLIAAKKKIVLNGVPDLDKGRDVARKTCLVCHKFHGEGAEVGPDLTGVGRSTLDALLANVIDPNQIIGAGYENVEVETRDGRTVSGRMVENNDNRVRLLATGPKEEIIARNDIAVENGRLKIRISELSVMPEGLEQMTDDDFRNLVWFILNPPEDKRPWTPALRKELIGDDAKPAKAASGEKQSADASELFRGQEAQPGDGESVALWNPAWKVICPPFEGAPKKLPEYAGRKNVLMTHPVDRTQPAALERSVELSAGKKSILSVAVAADEQGDWELRVFADGKPLQKQLVDKSGERWKTVSVDLTPFAGQTVKLRLENFPNDWSYEFGYWSDLEIKTTDLSARAR